MSSQLRVFVASLLLLALVICSATAMSPDQVNSQQPTDVPPPPPQPSNNDRGVDFGIKSSRGETEIRADARINDALSFNAGVRHARGFKPEFVGGVNFRINF